MKKLTSLILILTLSLAMVITSCDSAKKTDNNPDGDNNSATDSDNSNQSGDDKTAETTEERIKADLPDVNYDGYKFTVLAHNEVSDDWYQPEPREIIAQLSDTDNEVETGDPINDAVYKRNSILKDKYNIDFALVTNASEQTLLAKAVKAGDDIYDAVMMFNNNIPGIVQGDLLTDISKLPYIDLNKPWWDPAVNSMSVANKNFLLGGDILILDNEATNALVFNKDLMATLGYELPYNMVKEGKWTMDKLSEYVKGASSDLNGDGKMVSNEDRWGFICYNDTLHALLISGGGALAVKDENDIPYMDFTSPKNLTVIQKAMDIMYDKTNVLNIQADITTPGTNNENWLNTYHSSFEESRALFMWVRMRVVEKFRGMEANFGILPMPKFDESQDSYYSVVNPYTGVLLGVPKSSVDLERTSIILEAMAAESRYTIQPAYYDVVLQRKFARDEESSEMLDIIFNTRVYDIGGVYSFGTVFTEFIALCNKSDTNVASYYEKKGPAMQKAIDKLVDKIQSLD